MRYTNLYMVSLLWHGPKKKKKKNDNDDVDDKNNNYKMSSLWDQFLIQMISSFWSENADISPV